MFSRSGVLSVAAVQLLGPLQHGTYNDEPNHVTLGDGTTHLYAPPDDVPPEMHRLIEGTGLGRLRVSAHGRAGSAPAAMPRDHRPSWCRYGPRLATGVDAHAYAPGRGTRTAPSLGPSRCAKVTQLRYPMS